MDRAVPGGREAAGLTNAEVRRLKGLAQRLEPVLKVGKQGLSPAFLEALDGVLRVHELVKVRFDAFKEEKKALAPLLAAKSGSQLIHRVGNVAVLYRRRAVVAE
jgi:RNA-binding protein